MLCKGPHSPLPSQLLLLLLRAGAKGCPGSPQAALPLYVSCCLLRSGRELGWDGSETWLWSMLGLLDNPSSA